MIQLTGVHPVQADGDNPSFPASQPRDRTSSSHDGPAPRPRGEAPAGGAPASRPCSVRASWAACARAGSRVRANLGGMIRSHSHVRRRPVRATFYSSLPVPPPADIFIIRTPPVVMAPGIVPSPALHTAAFARPAAHRERALSRHGEVSVTYTREIRREAVGVVHATTRPSLEDGEETGPGVEESSAVNVETWTRDIIETTRIVRVRRQPENAAQASARSASPAAFAESPADEPEQGWCAVLLSCVSMCGLARASLPRFTD